MRAHADPGRRSNDLVAREEADRAGRRIDRNGVDEDHQIVVLKIVRQIERRRSEVFDGYAIGN